MMGRGSTNKRHQPTSVEKLIQTCAKPASASQEADLYIHSVKDATDFSGYNDEEKNLNITYFSRLPPRCTGLFEMTVGVLTT